MDDPPATTPPPVELTLRDGRLARVRSARPGDEDALAGLAERVWGASAAQEVRGQIDHREGVGSWSGAWVEGHLVAAAAGLERTLEVDDVAVPTHVLEFVMTDPDHRRFGAIRAVVGHQQARARHQGRLLGLVDGIPYLYRRFGYGYGLDWPAVVTLPPRHLRPAAPWDAPHAQAATARRLTPQDAPALRELDRHRPPAGVRVHHDDRWWDRWLAELGPDAHSALLGAERDGALVGWALLEVDRAEREVLLCGGTVLDDGAVAALVARARHDVPADWALEAAGGPAWVDHLARVGEPLTYGHGVYARIHDPVAMLDLLRPALDRRLAAAGRTDTGALDVSLYERTVRLELDEGSVARVEARPGNEDPFDDGEVGVAPDHLPALVLGRWGAAGLAERYDDVTLGRHGELMEVLFPRLACDVLPDL